MKTAGSRWHRVVQSPFLEPLAAARLALPGSRGRGRRTYNSGGAGTAARRLCHGSSWQRRVSWLRRAESRANVRAGAGGSRWHGPALSLLILSAPCPIPARGAIVQIHESLSAQPCLGPVPRQSPPSDLQGVPKGPWPQGLLPQTGRR